MFGQLKSQGLWGKNHEESEDLALRAERELHTNPRAARELYAQAAEKEKTALAAYPPERRHIEFYQALIVSAAALAVKGQDLPLALSVITTYGSHVRSDYYQRRLQEVMDALPKIS